jgi:hypothetical protein
VTRQPLTEAEIAELVHETVEGWTMPPVRLDAPGWRERVRSPRARRAATVRGWFAPLGRAATGAVVLTVVAALLAVVITRPPSEPGTSPGPSDGSSPRPTSAARPTPLPKLLANGELPSPSQVVVRTEPFTFAIVDLADGTIGPALISGAPWSALELRRDGTMVCLCVSESGIAANGPATRSIRLDRLDASGAVTSSTDIESFTGAADPRDGDVPAEVSVPSVRTAVSFSEGGSFGFVGWSYREHPSWKNGLLVVDLRTGEIVNRRDFPDISDGGEDSRTVVEAPTVVGAQGDELVVGRSWANLTPADSSVPTYSFDVDAFRVAYPGGVLGEPVAVPGMAGCGDLVRFGGMLPDGGTWVVCTRSNSFHTRLRRIASDGTTSPDVVVVAVTGLGGDASTVSPDGRTLFAWNPLAATMSRIDTATGELTTGDGRVARADAGPLVAFGRWLAPVASAKTFLESSVVLSPDGSRVYALGVTDLAGETESAGSAGVFVFDAVTLELLETYAPTADFVSLGIDPSGRYLFAAGLPGVDAEGGRRPDQQASVTVFDTTDGSVRLIAGQLGNRAITFGPETLQ